MEQEKIRPGKVWYVAAGITGVCFIFLFAFFIVSAVTCATDSITNRFSVPGTASMPIDKTGKYTLYFEYDSVMGGKAYHAYDISDMLFTLTNQDTGENIKLNDSVINSYYSINGISGKSIFDFEIDEPGQYVLETLYDSGSGQDAILAIGQPFAVQMVIRIFLAIGSFFLALIIPAIIIVVTVVKRSKIKKERSQKNRAVQVIG